MAIMIWAGQRWAKALVQTDHEHDLSVPVLWSNVGPTSRNDLIMVLYSCMV